MPPPLGARPHSADVSEHVADVDPVASLGRVRRGGRGPSAAVEAVRSQEGARGGEGREEAAK